MIIHDIENAKQIQENAFDVSSKLNNSLLEMQSILSDDEFNQYRLAVAKVLGEIFIEILHPIHKKYPELIPKEMKDS